MAEKFFSKRDLRFQLYDVADVESLTSYPYFSDHSKETFDMVIDTAESIAVDHMHPYLVEMDRQAPEYVDGGIKVHPAVKKYLQIAGEGGWINATFGYDHGGQQIPVTIANAATMIFSASNYSISVYPHLTTGAVHLIIEYGSQEQQDKYLEKLVAGQWQGTMALTEPEAGSSLSDVMTIAEPTDKGYYMMRGQKTFISAGDHNQVDNIVHMMLARVKGAPAGVKGLSLFIVPKNRYTESGGFEFNDVSCAGCYHKMGYKGAPIAQLSMGESDDCRGWLLGEENKGLQYMFQMMNEARIGVGIGAVGIATAAYHASLEYSKERLQGRDITEKDPAKPQVPIIKHADIKRMLMQQRVITEGGLGLAIYTGKLVDLARVTEGEEKQAYALLLDLLTPVVKTYPSEMGLLSTSNAIQILGGYGYSDEFPLEQFLRDMRIHPIHEGTTGIQGQDILGRKVTMAKGAAFKAFIGEVTKTITEAAGIDGLKQRSEELAASLKVLGDVTQYLTGFAAQGKVDHFLADATLYLELFGHVTIAWQWLIQGIAAKKALDKATADEEKNFYNGKIQTMHFCFEYELPKILGLEKRLKSGDPVTLNMKEDYFTV